ncbi:MAG: YdcF family protein [Anaerolineae bacterium]
MLASLVLLEALLFFSRERLLSFIGDYLIVEDSPGQADVIHVIAGDDYRTDYAIQLHQAGDARAIFFTGGWCTIHDYYHGAHGKQRAMAQGVPADAIAYDDSPVTSTYMEAERLKQWIDSSPTPIRSVIVVSDPFHMRRVSWIYRWVLGDKIKVQLAPVPFTQTPYQRAWWKDTASRAYVREEYGKLAYNLLRYRLSWGPFRDWLASLDTG